MIQNFCGFAKIQSYRMVGSENPYTIIDMPIHSQRVIAILINGEYIIDMNLKYLWFKQDDASCDTTLI